MAPNPLKIQKAHQAGQGSLKSYVTGFILSLGLTLAAFLFVWRHDSAQHTVFSHRFLFIAVISLSIAQLLVQLFFFLHLGREAKPRWNLAALIFAVTVVVIVVFGSLCIMSNLNYHHPSVKQTNQYLNNQGDGI